MVGVSHSTASSGPQRVAVVIAARDDREAIPATVRACYAIPDVDLIVVVDDGSDDDTAHAARGAGAVVVRHSVPRGRASALETGVKVVAMRDRVDWPARHLLFLDPNLGDSAVEATALVDAVNSKLCGLRDRRYSRGDQVGTPWSRREGGLQDDSGKYRVADVRPAVFGSLPNP